MATGPQIANGIDDDEDEEPVPKRAPTRGRGAARGAASRQTRSTTRRQTELEEPNGVDSSTGNEDEDNDEVTETRGSTNKDRGGAQRRTTRTSENEQEERNDAGRRQGSRQGGRRPQASAGRTTRTRDEDSTSSVEEVDDMGPRQETAQDQEQSEVARLLQNPALQALATLFVHRQGDRNGEPNAYRRAESAIRQFEAATDVEDWIKHFQRETEDLSHTQKMQLFRAKIMKECFAWYNDVEENAENDDRRVWSIHTWLEQLKKAYKPTSVQLRAAITARKQKEEEDAGKFIKEMVTLCKRYQPRMTIEDKIAYIEANVHPKYQRTFQLLNTHANSIEMAEQSLRNAMSIGGGSSEKVVEAPTENKQRIVRPSIPSLSAEMILDALKRVAEKPPTPAMTAAASFSRNEEPTSGSEIKTRATRTEGRPEQRQDADVRRCFNCDKLGHVASECWARRRGQSDRGRGFEAGDRNRFSRGAVNARGNGRENGQTGRNSGTLRNRESFGGDRRSGTPSRNSDGGCYRCGRMGHFARECYASLVQNDQSESPARSRASSASQTTSTSTSTAASGNAQ